MSSREEWSKLSPIGLDIGSEMIKCVQLKGSRRDLFLDRYAVISTPQGSVSNKVDNPKQVADVLRQMLRKKRFKSKKAVISLQAEAVIMREVEFPPMPAKELAESVRWEASKFTNLPPEELVADYIELGKGDDNKKELLLVAVPLEVINSYLEVCSLTGLYPQAIEVEPFALARTQQAFINREERSNSEEPEWLICVDIGSNKVGVLITRGNKYAFFRSFYHDQEKLVEGTLVQEIRRSMEYYLYKMGHREAVINRMFVTGGYCRQEGLKTFLAQSLGLEIHFLNPFAVVAHDRRYIASLLTDDAPLFAVAFGLALRGYRP